MDARAELSVRYERLRPVIPAIEWLALEPDVAAILALKRRRNAAILAHNYQRPEIFHGIADLTGDSLALARDALATTATALVVCGVRFMAETVKILNPDKTVLLPASDAGCSLVASITAEDVRALRRDHPGVPIVAYVNTTAEVKAESDICCTSANVAEVVRSLGAPRVIVVPDVYLARHAGERSGVAIIPWAGRCEVHERFRGEDLRQLRREHPGVLILAHPECPPDVAAEADFVDSTAGMVRAIREKNPPEAALVTECGMSDNVAADAPGTRFLHPCGLCPHMKRTTLERVRLALETMAHEIAVDAEVGRRARISLARMLAVPRGPTG